MLLSNKGLLGELLEKLNEFIDRLFIHKSLSEEKKIEIKTLYLENLKSYGEKKGKYLNPTDVANKLNFVCYEWNQFKGIFGNDNNKQKMGRSYINILSAARNEWAHSVISIPDLEYYSETALRLVLLAKDFPAYINIGEIKDKIQENINNTDRKINNSNEITSLETNQGERQILGANWIKLPEDEGEREVLRFLSHLAHNYLPEYRSIVDFIISFDLESDGEYTTKIIKQIATELNLVHILGLFKGYDFFVDAPNPSFPSYEEIISDDDIELPASKCDAEFIKMSLHLYQENGISTFGVIFYNDAFSEFTPEIIQKTIQKLELNELYSEYERVWPGFFQIAAEIRSDGYKHFQEGKYPKTLYFKHDIQGWAWGPRKLNLVIRNIEDIRKFAEGKRVNPILLDTFKGYPVICFPTADNWQISFGRGKAQFLLEAEDEIRQWLTDTNNWENKRIK